ncbi:ribulose-phosphate 3-epimerase [Anaerolentibacter hominis]|uniref:ribulose-phosphate 3-epimerase n=1 Tax=Anaerolentibacter hominis TaxID=3079009 RepID=UPI0031B80A95
MTKKLLCPSMMCADFERLGEEVRLLDEAGADLFHVDVMDGNFVPNYAMGLEDFKCVRKNTRKPVDVHLMVKEPETAVRIFGQAGADIIYVHGETGSHPARILEEIKHLGAKAGLALNPGTSIGTVEELLPLADYVLAMTVNPGFAGQAYLEFVTDKLIRLSALKEKYAFRLVTDGAMSPERIQELRKLGVDGFVLGTSALFGKPEDYRTILSRLRDGKEG